MNRGKDDPDKTIRNSGSQEKGGNGVRDGPRTIRNGMGLFSHEGTKPRRHEKMQAFRFFFVSFVPSCLRVKFLGLPLDGEFSLGKSGKAPLGCTMATASYGFSLTVNLAKRGKHGMMGGPMKNASFRTLVRVLVLCLLCFGHIGCAHQKTNSATNVSRPQPIEKLSCQSSVQVEHGLETLHYSEPGLSVDAVRKFRHDKANDDYPCTLISVRVNNVEIPIPRSSYSSCIEFDPRSQCLALSCDKSTLFLTYMSGDGASSRVIVYCISNGALVEIR